MPPRIWLLLRLLLITDNWTAAVACWLHPVWVGSNLGRLKAKIRSIYFTVPLSKDGLGHSQGSIVLPMLIDGCPGVVPHSTHFLPGILPVARGTDIHVSHVLDV